MAKSDLLTKAEVDSFRPNPELLRYIFRAKAPSGPTLRVLNWGCGRGRLVLYLLRSGCDCYGIDIDPAVIDKARDLYRAEGYDPDHRLRVLDPEMQLEFSNGFFDVIVSDNVLEHVHDLGDVMAEMARLTRPGGWGFHLFPGRFTVVEGHLFMPFVHWLPKNWLRELAIRSFVALGVEPHWREAGGLGTAAKAELYYRYSCEKTFYRAPRTILDMAHAHGFVPHLVSARHPRVESAPFLRRLARSPGGRILNELLAELKAVELLLEKEAV